MPYPRRFYRAEAFDHGEMLSRPRYGFLAAAVFTLFIGAFMGSGMTFQPKTHALVIDLPQLPTPEVPLNDIPFHTIRITPVGELLWDGEPVNSAQLVSLLQATLEEPVQPGISLEPDADASYDFSLRVLNIIASTGLADERFCFGNISQFGNFPKDSLPLRPILVRPDDPRIAQPGDPPPTRLLDYDPRMELWPID